MSTVLVTGGKGQLGTCIRDLVAVSEHAFVFVDFEELDITDSVAVHTFFNEGDFDFCVNCAAYTAVDTAETEVDKAKEINQEGALFLAEACKVNAVKLIHISTDFVFDGNQTSFYTEDDVTEPLGVYGITKLAGEDEIARTLSEHIIIRTSWLYSEHGSNFMKTMIRLGAERDTLNVVCDQLGTPTYGGDLAALIIRMIDKNTDKYGRYHYSNEGVASWYDFAQEIFRISNTRCKVYPIKTEEYPTPAERPAFSILDKSKVTSTFDLKIPYWRDSLKTCIGRLNVSC